MNVPPLARLLAFLLLFSVQPAIADTTAFEAGIDALAHKSFRDKAEAVVTISDSGAARAQAVLSALLEGKLYIKRDGGQVVIAVAEPLGSAIVDAKTGASLGALERGALKKVIINNKMRGSLRTGLARLRLRDPEAAARRRAVTSLFASLSEDNVELLRETLLSERDRSVQEALRVALALADLGAPDAARQLSAIEALAGNMHGEVHNHLANLLEPAADVSGAERNASQMEVQAAAAAAIEGIDGKRRLYHLYETTFFGLSLGFVLVLAAMGLAITFGVMGVINMAHGELIMLGAYSTWVVQQAMPAALGWSLIAAIPVAFVVAGLAGIAIERGVVRFLYGRPLETLLATFGVSLILQQAVRSIFSPLNRAVATPDWMSGQLVVNEALAFTNNRLYIIVFSIAVFMSVNALLRFTTLGLHIRAVSQNRDMARAMGVRGGWIDATTFGLGAGVAGLAGVALSQLTNVGPNLGQSYIVDSFMVVVFGGVGNLWGTLLAGLTLGLASKFLEPVAGAVLAKVCVLVFIILFIQRRPRGLVPQRGRAAEA